MADRDVSGAERAWAVGDEPRAAFTSARNGDVDPARPAAKFPQSRRSPMTHRRSRTAGEHGRPAAALERELPPSNHVDPAVLTTQETISHRALHPAVRPPQLAELGGAQYPVPLLRCGKRRHSWARETPSSVDSTARLPFRDGHRVMVATADAQRTPQKSRNRYAAAARPPSTSAIGRGCTPSDSASAVP